MKLSRNELRKIIVEMTSSGGVVQEVQSMVNQNKFLKGSIVAPKDLIKTSQYVVYASDEGLMHTKDRHMNVNAPGSTMFPNVNLQKVIAAIASTPKTSVPDDFMVKWEGVVSPTGPIGEMGVLYANPMIVSMMQDYQMPGGRKEIVKVAPGNRIMTELVTLVTAPLGMLSDGRQALSLVTMYPGGNDVEGVVIPRDRNDFAASGLYFVLPPGSPILN